MTLHLVQRTSVVIFSADNIPMSDPDTTYFGLIPYKKRLIKRLVGKPGDSIYFYGGKIYSVDKDGKPVEELLNSPWLDKIEYVPFLSFSGDLSSPSREIIQFEQMHEPVGRLVQTADGKILPQIYNGSEWIKDQPLALRTPHDTIKTYSDFLGMRNYGVARLLTKEQLNNFEGIEKSDLEDGVLYLQIMHTPNLTYPKPEIHQQDIHLISLIPYSTIIPLKEEHIKAIMDNMYTARFVIKAGWRNAIALTPRILTIQAPVFRALQTARRILLWESL